MSVSRQKIFSATLVDSGDPDRRAAERNLS
jgi:hypothetical protein